MVKPGLAAVVLASLTVKSVLAGHGRIGLVHLAKKDRQPVKG
jgi:hypothetical protein